MFEPSNWHNLSLDDDAVAQYDGVKEQDGKTRRDNSDWRNKSRTFIPGRINAFAPSLDSRRRPIPWGHSSRIRSPISTKRHGGGAPPQLTSPRASRRRERQCRARDHRLDDDGSWRLAFDEIRPTIPTTCTLHAPLRKTELGPGTAGTRIAQRGCRQHPTPTLLRITCSTDLAMACSSSSRPTADTYCGSCFSPARAGARGSYNVPRARAHG